MKLPPGFKLEEPELPPGFVLEESELPQGFVLEESGTKQGVDFDDSGTKEGIVSESPPGFVVEEPKEPASRFPEMKEFDVFDPVGHHAPSVPLEIPGVRETVRTGAGALAAFTRHTSAFMDALDSMVDYVSEITGLEKGGLFESAAEIYARNADYWDEKVAGATLPEQVVAEFLGGAAPGMAEFMMGVPYAGAVGFVEGGAKGAAESAAKRSILGKILHASNILKMLPRTAAMAGVGATEAAAAGGDVKEIAKSAGVMAGFGMVGPRRGIGLREAVRGKRPPVTEVDIQIAREMEAEMALAEKIQAGAKWKAAAIKTPEGIFEGKIHADAYNKIVDKFGDQQTSEWLKYGRLKPGHVSKNGEFLTNDQAIERWGTRKTEDLVKINREMLEGTRKTPPPPIVKAEKAPFMMKPRKDRWRQPLLTYQEYLKRHPKATADEVAKNTELSYYQAETLHATGELQKWRPPELPTQSGVKFNPIEPGMERSSILKQAEEKLGVPIRIGKIKKKEALGIYKTRQKVIRIKSGNDLAVAAHEIGHHIQKILRITDPPPEVLALATPGIPKQEGFAEFVRTFIMSPSEAQKISPSFNRDFTRALEKHPDIKDVIYKARQHAELWNAASPTQRFASFIKYGHEIKTGKMPTLNEMYRGVIDELRPYQQLTNLLKERTGKELKPSEDPYILSRLFKGWPRKANMFLKYGTFQMTPEGMVKTGKSLRERLRGIESKGELHLLDTFLLARQAVHDSRVNEAFEGRGIVKPGDAAAVVKDLEPRFKKVADELYEYNDQLLTYLQQSGRISKELADRIREKNLFYAPLYRVFDNNPSGTLGGRGVDNVFNPIKRRKKSSRDVISPIENMVKNTYMFINAAERNRIGRALLKITEYEGMGDVIERTYFEQRPEKVKAVDALKQIGKTLETLPSDKALDFQVVIDQILGHQKQVKQIIERSRDKKWMEENGLEGLEALMEKADLKPEDIFLLQQFAASFKPVIRSGKNEAIFYENGEPYLVEMAPELAKAVKALDVENLNLVMKLLSLPAKGLRAGATTLSPEFVARNPIRDQWSAMVYSKYGYVPGFDLLRGIFHMVRKDALYEQFSASGAAHATIVSIDRDYISKNLQEVMKGKWKRPKDIIKSPLTMLQALSEFMEEGSRVGEFNRALKKEGADIEGLLKSGLAARDVTLDFQRMGTHMKGWNAITAFFNAQIQGTDKMIRELFTNKGTRGKTLLKALAGITAPSVALWLAQHDDPHYQEMPTWRKILFWNLITYPNGRDKKPRIWSIPKPFELGVIFGSTPELALNYIKEQDPKAIEELARSVAGGLFPNMAPTVAIPVAEWMANKNFFFDFPLEPRGTEEASPWMRYGEYTPESLKLLTKGMSHIPGLRELASPEKIENMIYAWSGGAGRLTLNNIDILLREFDVIDTPPRPPMSLEEIPGIRGFTTRYPSANTRSIEQFYDRYIKNKRKYKDKRIEMGLDRVGARLKRGEVKDIKLEAAGPQLIADEITARQLSKLRIEARKAWRSRELTPEQKKDQLESLYWDMIDTARSALGKEELRK